MAQAPSIDSRPRTITCGLLLIGSVAIGKIFLWRNPPVSAHLEGTSRLLPLLLIVLATLLLAVSDRARSLTRPPSAISHAIWVWLFLVCFATATVASTPRDFWGMLMPYFIAAVTFLAASHMPAWQRIRELVTVSAIILALTVVLDAKGLWPSDPERRPGGILQNRNFAGEYLALALPVCLVALRGHIRALALPLLGLALTLTRCRTAWLSTGIGILILFALGKDTRGRFVAAAALLALGAAMAGLVPTRLHWQESRPHAATLTRIVDLHDGSGRYRVRQYGETLALVAPRWMTGLGPGNWQQEIRARDPQLGINRVPHSDYLRVISDGGAPALFSLAAIYVAAAVLAWRRRHDSPEGFAFVIALVVTSFADSPLYRLETTVLAFTVFGSLARAERASGNLRSPTYPRRNFQIC